jgi:hypothetical protein
MSNDYFFVFRQDDHDFGGLDQRSGDLALLAPQFTDCVGGNDRSNVLFADRWETWANSPLILLSVTRPMS